MRYEDVDVHFLSEPRQRSQSSRHSGFIIVVGDNGRRFRRKFGNPGEDIFWCVGCKVSDEFVVDGQIRSQHEKVINPMHGMQVADERSHKAGFAHPSREGKAKRRELPFKVGDGRKLAFDRRQCRTDIRTFLGRDNLCHAIENLQRVSLWWSEAESARDSVDVTVHKSLFIVQSEPASWK